MIKGVDISNLQGPPESYRAQTWYQQADFVLVQAISPPAPYPGWQAGGYTEVQLRAAKADGKKVGIYVFLWNTLRDVAADIGSRLATVPADIPLDMRPWVDAEDETPASPEARQEAILSARRIVDAFANARGMPPSGGYSRDQYIRDFLGGWWPQDWVYWQAAPGGDPADLLPMRPIRQYASDVVDHDSMLESELVTPFPVPRETPPDWPWPTWYEAAVNYQAIAQTLGQKIAAAKVALA